MAFYWKKYDLLYLHYPKTGGTSLRMTLEKALGPSEQLGDAHNTYREACKYFEPSYKIMTIMTTRNPYSRFYSHWKNQRRDWRENGENGEYPHTFTEYVSIGRESQSPEFKQSRSTKRIQIHWNRSVMEHCKNTHGKIIVDEFISIENLQVGVDLICKMFGVNTIGVSKKNASEPQDDYKRHYTNKTQKIITEHCKEEIDHFNYKF